MAVYLSSVAETFGTILQGSALRHLRLTLAEDYLSHGPSRQLFIEAYDCHITLLILIPLSEHCVEILPYSYHNLRFLLQNL